MMNKLEPRIRELLDHLLAEADGYLVDLKIRPNKVEVFADRDPHITIEDCARISRALEHRLNAEFNFSQQYALEVSSPGMDVPLRVLRQYKKNTGRMVDVLLFSGQKKRGTLLYADDEKILLEEEMNEKESKAAQVQTEIFFVNIKSTTLVINFKF